MAYKAPVEEMMFVLENLCDLQELAKLPGFEEAQPDMISAVLTEAGKFADQVLAPLNRKGDIQGAKFDQGKVTTPDGWKQAYDQMVEMGWNSPKTEPEHGGIGMPSAVNACLQEMFTGANTAFSLCPLLTQGAIESISGFASQELKQTYLPNLVSGIWAGTMNLTEPDAGSDLAAVKSKAVPHADHYLISGQKIYITYGEHDLTENIIHLVLARLPDAPDGVKGISLFIVPKFLVNDDGSLGARNDVDCISTEHKLGIHASPTCTMSYGAKGGAVGYLVGEPHAGLKYMFTMMNAARLGVGLQGIGIAEHATQDAVGYAMDRKQGPTVESSEKTIIGHPDIRRMLGLMKSRTEAARALACRAAMSEDFAHHAPDPALKAYHQRRLDLLIPVVKGWSTELAIDTASLGIQVHGGMGYVEETGVAQHLRDARITTIYEGTTGIQALDLIGRKIKRDEGLAAQELVADMRQSADHISRRTDMHADWTKISDSVHKAARAVEETTHWLVGRNDYAPLAAAVNVMELFGIALGTWMMGLSAAKAADQLDANDTSQFALSKLTMAGFFIGHTTPKISHLTTLIQDGANDVLQLAAKDLAVAS